MEPSVVVKDLRITYGALDIIAGLNLEIERGEFLVLLGPSGCGKSTLLNAIAGLIGISDGEISISGKNVTWEEPKDRGIAMVFQSYALYPQMTARGNLSFGLKIAGMPQAEIDQRVERAAKILQIEPLLARKPAALSGGQRQRVAIGRALVRDVDVYLFDEPLSNLDAKLRSELRVEIKRLHEDLGNTMIYVTHDQIEALTLADRIAILRGGIIQQLAPPKTVYNRPANLFVAGFIGSPSMNFLDGAVEQDAGGPVFRFAGSSVPLAAYEGADRLSSCPEAVLGIRPEHIEIRPDTAEGISAVIDIDEPMGSESLLWMKLTDRPFSVKTTSDHGLVRGQSVKLAFDIAKASLFDKKSELRL